MPSHQRLIIFNGPPRSGKTTAASYAVSQIEKWSTMTAKQLDLATPLKSATKSLFVAHLNDWEGEMKDTPHPDWLGMSYREALITVSERMVKPVMGADFFGRIGAKTMAQNKHVHVWVVGDGGFADECKPLINSVGHKHTLVVELHATKEGQPLTFAGDSRSYIGQRLADECGVKLLKVPNVIGSVHDRILFHTVVWGIVKEWLKIDDGSDA